MIEILNARPGVPVHIGRGIVVTVFVRGNAIKLGVQQRDGRSPVAVREAAGDSGEPVPPRHRDLTDSGYFTRS